MAYQGLEEAGPEAARTGFQVRRVSLVGDITVRSFNETNINFRARRILFFPYGNHSEHASFYLEQAWDGEPPENWYACVQFALVLSNVKDPSIHVSHGKYPLDYLVGGVDRLTGF